MGFLKTVFAITAQNFRKWQTDYRIWMIAVLMTVITLIYVDDVKKLADYLSADVPVWIFPFMYSQFYIKVMYTLPIILMFCDAPFVDKNQVFTMMRTTRTKWICGQILYIIFASGIYFLFLLLISLLLTVFYGGFSFEWGTALTAEAFSTVSIKIDLQYFQVSRLVVENFTPLLAVFYTFLLSFLGAVFLGSVIMMLNLLTNSRVWGMAVSSALVVLSIAAAKVPRLMPFSPISWTTLNNIDVGRLTRNPSIVYVLTAYAILIILPIAAILILGRKKSLDTKGDQ